MKSGEAMAYVPDSGDIVWIMLDPQAGHDASETAKQVEACKVKNIPLLFILRPLVHLFEKTSEVAD